MGSEASSQICIKCDHFLIEFQLEVSSGGPRQIYIECEHFFQKFPLENQLRSLEQDLYQQLIIFA